MSVLVSRNPLPILAGLCGGLLLSACHEAKHTTPAEPAPERVAALGYSIRPDPAEPLRLQARLDLEASDEPRGVHARGVGLGLGSQVRAPACEDTPLEASGEHQWILPAGCGAIRWSIELVQATPNTVDAATQLSLFFAEPGWWLLSEPTSLLRVEHAQAHTSLPLLIEGLAPADSVVGGRRMGEGWRVPPLDSAPEFFVFGNLQLRKHQVGAIEITHVIDDVERFDRLPLIELHARALAYLADVFQVPADLSPSDRHLMIVWLGIDETLGEAGGAAGSRSFLANYVDGEADSIELNAARTLLVLAHEQAHQLHDLMWRGGAPLPTWMGEGLAHYYGLKALARSELSAEVVARPMNAFIDPSRPVEFGLVEYQRRHASGSPEAYEMFYFQGATLWSEVDRLLLQAAPDGGGLDALMPEILQLDVQDDGLPEALHQRLLALAGEPMAALLARMVGD